MIDFFKRLDKYLKYRGLNDNKMTIETGLSNGLIGKARKRGALSQENISKILQKYNELDANWLLTGEGFMLKSEYKGLFEDKNDNDFKTIELIKSKDEFDNKDLLIQSYLQNIETQKKLIDKLEEENKTLKEELKAKEKHSNCKK